jgi:drug/metabolite transporter (DMT)-like permease
MRQLSGILLIIVSAVAFGALSVLGPIAYQAGTNPVSLMFLRFTIAGLAMGTFLMVRRVRFPRGRLLAGFALMGGVWYVAQSLAYYTALTTVPVGLVALLLYLYPAVVALISTFVLREPLIGPKWVALGLALVGAMLTIGPGGGAASPGMLLALVAALLYAGYIVVGDRLMQQAEALPATAVIMLAAAASYGGIVAVQGFAPPVTTVGWLAILATAGCSIIALGAFFAGLGRVGSANAAILSTAEPFVAVGLAALLLGEKLGIVQLVGGLCILVAVVLLARSELATGRRARSP